MRHPPEDHALIASGSWFVEDHESGCPFPVQADADGRLSFLIGALDDPAAYRALGVTPGGAIWLNADVGSGLVCKGAAGWWVEGRQPPLSGCDLYLLKDGAIVRKWSVGRVLAQDELPPRPEPLPSPEDLSPWEDAVDTITMPSVVAGTVWPGIPEVGVLMGAEGSSPPSSPVLSAHMEFRKAGGSTVLLTLTSADGGVLVVDAENWRLSVPRAVLPLGAGSYQALLKAVDAVGPSAVLGVLFKLT